MIENKFHFRCQSCGFEIPGFKELFKIGSYCPECNERRFDTIYHTHKDRYRDLIFSETKPANLWHFQDFLPLQSTDNIVSKGERTPPVERWEFLEHFAKKKYSISCEIFVLRNDLHQATGTIKDLGASLAASVLKEQGITEYVVASTGNTATAYASYLASAGISLTVFIPSDAYPQNEAEIGSYGQRVYKVSGDYAMAKKMARDYSQKYNQLLTTGNFDPLRIEAKKTIVFEWLRSLEGHPSVYIQALSGGTCIFAIEKAWRDMQGTGLFEELPRLILCQPSGCAPMADAWQKAKKAGFPAGFEKDYPVYKNPVTLVPTLATGDPYSYPSISRIVKQSKGEILTLDEKKVTEIIRLTAYETTVRIGPASAVALGGLFSALDQNLIRDGDKTLINLGEGASRAAEIMNQMPTTTIMADSIDDCKPFNRKDLEQSVWEPFL